VNQNGAQGGVARHSNDMPLGIARLAQKLSATTLPAASRFVYAMHNRLRDTLLPYNPQSVGQLSGPSDQRYNTQAAVAGHTTGTLGDVQKLSATTTTSPLMVPLHTIPAVTLDAAKPQYVGHCTALVSQYGEHGGVASQDTDGRSPAHQLSASTTTSPLTVPLHTTPCVTSDASRPHVVGHTTSLDQYGAHGGVAEQFKLPFGFARLAQKLSSTVRPAGLADVVSIHNKARWSTLSSRPHVVGQYSSFTRQWYSAQIGVAGHTTGGFGLAHQLSAMITIWLLIVPLHTMPAVTLDAAKPQ
jgi:hypothetical protein